MMRVYEIEEKGQNKKNLRNFLHFLPLYDIVRAFYYENISPMSINTPINQENLLQRAKDCLEERSEEIDYIVDSCQSSYRTAQINTLAKYLCKGDITEAKKLLEQIQIPSPEIEEQIQETELMVHEILKDPYDALVEQFTTEYENFCEEQHLNTNIPIPENLRDVIIFEFSKN